MVALGERAGLLGAQDAAPLCMEFCLVGGRGGEHLRHGGMNRGECVEIADFFVARECVL